MSGCNRAYSPDLYCKCVWPLRASVLAQGVEKTDIQMSSAHLFISTRAIAVYGATSSTKGPMSLLLVVFEEELANEATLNDAVLGFSLSY